MHLCPFRLQSLCFDCCDHIPVLIIRFVCADYYRTLSVFIAVMINLCPLLLLSFFLFFFSPFFHSGYRHLLSIRIINVAEFRSFSLLRFQTFVHSHYRSCRLSSIFVIKIADFRPFSV